MTSMALAIRGAAKKPPSVQPAVLALVLVGLGATGFATAGLAGLAVFASVFASVFGVAVFGSSPAVRALATRSHERRQRQARRDDRERSLASLPSGRLTLAELTRLVDEIERRDPERARAFDLETLLDRHASLTIAHDRALRAASMSDRVQLEHIRDSCRTDPAVDPRRWDLAERRVQCFDSCVAVAETIANELAIVAETIRLIAQRVACPDPPERDDLIARQLAELDESDAARRELAELGDEPVVKVLPAGTVIPPLSGTIGDPRS